MAVCCQSQEPDGVGRIAFQLTVPLAAPGWGTEQPVGFCEGDTAASLTSEASISRCGTCSPCPGTLTVGFVTVRGLNAYQDVLVQQVLGVRDDGLQL